MSRSSKSLIWAWVPAAAWLAVIAWESLSLSTTSTSRILLPLLRWLFPAKSPEQVAFLHALIRKFGHFFGYSLLGLFLFRGWWATRLSLALRRASESDASAGVSKADWMLPGWKVMLSLWSGRAAILAVLGTMIVACVDEWHQSTVLGRTGTVHDVVLDTLGGLFAMMVVLAASSGRIRKVELASPTALRGMDASRSVPADIHAGRRPSS